MAGHCEEGDLRGRKEQAPTIASENRISLFSVNVFAARTSTSTPFRWLSADEKSFSETPTTLSLLLSGALRALVLASLPLQSSLMSKAYLKSDHFNEERR